MILPRACVGVLLLVLAGCSTNFRPIEANSRVPSDMAAAEYSLSDAAKNLGAAQVWLMPPEDDDSQLIQLGMRLRNEGDSPVRLDLDDTELEARTMDGQLHVIEQIQSVVGDQSVEPRSTGRVELSFLLPADVTFEDLAGFELIWAVATDDGTRVTRSTTFVRETWQQAQDRRYRR